MYIKNPTQRAFGATACALFTLAVLMATTPALAQIVSETSASSDSGGNAVGTGLNTYPKFSDNRLRFGIGPHDQRCRIRDRKRFRRSRCGDNGQWTGIRRIHTKEYSRRRRRTRASFCGHQCPDGGRCLIRRGGDEYCGHTRTSLVVRGASAFSRETAGDV